MLEDIEAASLKIFLRNELKAIDDQSLKKIDWKPIVGKYLVRAKYLILRWTSEDSLGQRTIPDLSQEIQELAVETDVLHIPDYTPPSTSTLLNGIKDFESVKDHLVEGDKASMVLPNEEEAEFNLSVRLNMEDIEALVVRETQTHSVSSMVLFVKKPDCLGTSMWNFRHGRQSLNARLEDKNWLEKFQNRHIDVRPGDALRCEVRIDMGYGYDNELVVQKYYVTKVKDVLSNQYRQLSMDD